MKHFISQYWQYSETFVIVVPLVMLDVYVNIFSHKTKTDAVKRNSSIIFFVHIFCPGRPVCIGDIKRREAELCSNTTLARTPSLLQGDKDRQEGEQ